MGTSRKTVTGEGRGEKEVLGRGGQEGLMENKGRREENAKKTEQTERVLTDS